jgi:hypothetical protein
VIGFLRAAFVDVRLRSGAGRNARNLLRRAGEKARRLPRDERRELALELRAVGISYREIAGALQVDYARVSRWLDDDGCPASPAAAAGASRDVATDAPPTLPPEAGRAARVARLEARLDRIEARLDRLIN